MAWKQHPIYSNMETDGIYTRPKIDPFEAFTSGYTGGDNGKWTHRHSDWQMGKNCSPIPNTRPSTSTTPSTPKVHQQVTTPTYRRSATTNYEADSSFPLRGKMLFSLFLTALLFVLFLWGGEPFEGSLVGAVVFGAAAFLGIVIMDLLFSALWALRWIIFSFVGVAILLPLIY